MAGKKPNARAIVKGAMHFDDPKVLLGVSEDLTGEMESLTLSAG
jgi:pyridoxal biosynthesis lyase PdxS